MTVCLENKAAMRRSHCVGRLRRLVDARRTASRRVARGMADGTRGKNFHV
ncbi:hypothetical protein [Fischerella sp. FACHB-380]|nr:hypothetical protein [Fischerella sp. FACHB-380]MBD2433005.1 hypothetical protein [Fischerella sp. FACHB-380]